MKFALLALSQFLFISCNMEQIAIDLKELPAILEPSRAKITELLEETINSFKYFLDSELAKLEIPLFTLPDQVPGTEIAANLSFYELSLQNSRVQALVKFSS